MNLFTKQKQNGHLIESWQQSLEIVLMALSYVF